MTGAAPQPHAPPRSEPAAKWVYEGLWAVLVRWFRVPERPPAFPAGAAGAREEEAFKPAMAFLKYLKLWFWIVLILVDIGLIMGWIGIASENVIVALALLPVLLALIIVPAVLGYIGLHLRYDTTWYVMTDRAIRIRRGVWTIQETTLTFENVQNVKIKRGPVQRLFGIESVIIETAGSGGGEGKHGGSVSNQGIIEGIADATRVRDLILRRLRGSRTAGLGDEVHEHEVAGAPGWTAEHLAVLREIRGEIAALGA